MSVFVVSAIWGSSEVLVAKCSGFIWTYLRFLSSLTSLSLILDNLLTSLSNIALVSFLASSTV